MRTEERYTKLKKWTYEVCCRGRLMKAPGTNMDVREISMQEPQVWLAYTPMRPDNSEMSGQINPLNVAPGIVIVPGPGYLKNMEEQRFDRYNKVARPKEFGQTLTCQVLFFVWEDGVRLPGFTDSAKEGEYDMALMAEGTENGLFTLFNWMDDFKDALLSEKSIPDTDMFLISAESTYQMYTDQKFVADRRPAFIGYVTVSFYCEAAQFNDEELKLLM